CFQHTPKTGEKTKLSANGRFLTAKKGPSAESPLKVQTNRPPGAAGKAPLGGCFLLWFAVVFGCKTGVHRLFGLDCLEKEGDYRPEHTVRICCCDSALISFGCVPYAFQPPAMVYFIRLGSLQGAVLHGRGLPISVFNLD